MFPVFRIFLTRLVRVCLLLSLFSSFLAQAEVVATDWLTDAYHPPVAVRLVLTGQSDPQSGEAAGYLEVKLDKGWKTYWRSPGEGGVAPEIDWSASENVSDFQWHWPFPSRFSLLGIETIGYQGDTLFPITLKIQDWQQPVLFKARLRLSSCSTVCVITDYPVELSFIPDQLMPSSNEVAQYAQAMSRVPQKTQQLLTLGAVWDEAQQRLQITAHNPQGWQQPDLLLDGQSDKVAESSFTQPRIQVDGQNLTATFTVSSWLGKADLSGESVQVTFADQSLLVEQTVAIESGLIQSTTSGWALVLMFASALLGGLILNVMPCVLPVLGMKLTSVLTLDKPQRRSVRLQFLTSAAGILSAFWLIAIGLLALKWSGQAIGWGIQFQSASFIVLMLLITTLFGANMLGLFELRLPVSASTWMATRGSDQRYLGHYLQGMFATLLATPCSTPFLGTAVAFALGADTLTLWFIFTGLGIGMALPWLLVALFPQLALRLPKPGAWMNRIKILFGLMLLATSLWLLTLLAAHWPLWAILLYLLSTLALCVWQGWRHYGDQRIVLFVLITVLSFGAGLWLAKLSTTHGLTQLSDDLPWQPLVAEQIAQHVEQGKVVLVDVTADWCITCKVNKMNVLLQNPVHKALQQEEVVLIRGDWTLPSESVTRFLQNHGRFGVPFNIVYGPQAPQGIALPVLLTDRAVMDALRQAKGEAR
ncbi:protein-disulfide reductase DsbD family protein [Vibrio metschnikovii]|uniref:protein-disulfide reductase DsbD family protein n=1 Tax=Vibrio metschnikovii TaxID=28172 RepID=UPI001C30150B|nr:protein-disulfide reductase DsbD domain-containing protein [Vibrio metschnikovii]